MLPFLLPCPADAGIAARFAYLANAVMVYVAARVKHAPSDWHGVLMPLAFANLINGWIMQRRTRVLALLARVEQGRQRKPVPYKARADRPDVAKAAIPPRQPGFRPPAQFAWLCTLAQEVRGMGGLLAVLVTEAELKANILAHPQLGRLIRPLLKMLGEAVPDWMAPPRRPRRMPTAAPRRRRATRWTTGTTAAPERDDASHRFAAFVETERARQYAAAVAMGRPPPPAPPPMPRTPSTEWQKVRWRGKTVAVLVRRGWDL